MYKNLNASSLGISGRQSDLIELAMTYGFQGLDIDAVDLQVRTARTDFDRAARFLTSSSMRVSGFDVPCNLDADDKDFEQSLKLVEQVVKVAGMVKARAGFLAIPSATNRAPFPQYFEWIKSRIERLAGIFEANNVLLALHFSTFSEDRESLQYQFIQDVNGALALIQACPSKSVGMLIETFHWTVGRGTWEQLEGFPAGRIGGLNIADASEIPEISDCKESHKLVAASVGIIDNARFAKILSGSAYDGPITSTPALANLGSVKRDLIASKAQDVLDSTLTQAGLATQTRRPEVVAAQSRFAPYTPGIEELG
jgi:sugar phosphate isomerase/epimerase